MDSWTDELGARERVRTIASTLSRPRSVNWVRKEADVSWETARSELDALVEHGRLRRVYPDDEDSEDAAPLYAPDYKTQYLARIRELTDDNSRAELREEIASIQDEIDAWKDEYGVEGRAELEATLAEENLTGQAVRERSRVLRRWRRNEETKKLLGHALRLYDDLSDLHADSHTGSPA